MWRTTCSSEVVEKDEEELEENKTHPCWKQNHTFEIEDNKNVHYISVSSLNENVHIKRSTLICFFICDTFCLIVDKMKKITIKNNSL